MSESTDFSPDDAKFIVAILNNAVGKVNVDYNGVASDLGMTNPRSASNRWAVVRKRYNLTIEVTGSAAKKESTGDGEPVTPKKVTKNTVKNTPTPRKSTPKKPAAKKRKVEMLEDDDAPNYQKDSEAEVTKVGANGDENESG